MRQNLRQEFLRAVAARAAEEIGPSARPRRSRRWSMKITRLATLRAKPISWVTHHHGHALAGEIDHHVEHFLDHFGVERRGRLVEQHRDRVHRQRARDRDALLLAAGQFAPDICCAWSVSPTRSSSFAALGHRLVVRAAQHLLLRQAQILDDPSDAETARNAGTPCRPARAVSADRSWDR